MLARRHVGRNLLISFCVGLICFYAIANHEMPSVGVIYAYLYELQRLAHGSLIEYGDSIPIPKPKKSIKQTVAEINAKLQAMDDMELRSISVAQRPCASGLLDCEGMSEGWVVRSALAEVADRAKKRDQEIAEKNAEASRRSAEIAARNLWIAGAGGGIAGIVATFAGLTYRETRRRNREEEAYRAVTAAQNNAATATPPAATTTPNPTAGTTGNTNTGAENPPPNP